MFLRRSLFLSSFLSCVFLSYELSVDILEPTKDGQEVALIIAPGAKIEGAAYKPLASFIQKTSPLKLWIALLDGFFYDLPNKPQFPEAVDMAINALNKKGLKNNTIFIAGHSLGGTVLASYASTNYKKFQGVLLYSAYLERGNKLKGFNVPLLTLSGELDGLTRITRILETFEELSEDVTADRKAMFRTPVIVMPGVNHGQFASGPMPSTVVAYDLPPDVSNVTAYSAIANYTSAFISATIFNTTESLMQLERGYTSTEALMKPLLTVKAFDVNPQLSSRLAVEGQYIISGLKERQHLQVKDVEIGEAQFVSANPRVSVQNGTIDVINYATITYSPDPLDVSTEPQGPLEIQAKFKSKESLKVLYPNGTFSAENKTCKDINMMSYAYALAAAAPTSVKRMQTRGISNVIFKEDIQLPKIAVWDLEPLDIDYEANGLQVTSYSFIEPVDSRNKMKGGLHNCKLLSPFRAIEWIYVDNLRNYNLTNKV